MTTTAPDPRSPKEIWELQHQILMSTPINWLMKAESLMDAFEVLIADDLVRAETGRPRRVLSVAYMLAGYAMENLLKGQLIARQPRQADSSKPSKFKFKSHDLGKLARAAGYSLTVEEAILLERIEQFTLWTARYPAPIDVDDMRPRPTLHGGFAPRTFHALGEDWDPIRCLLSRFKTDLVQRC